tara:strand:- start:71 stop:607 length:537 start_codon:yes stop_codon:yes gene_type:complete
MYDKWNMAFHRGVLSEEYKNNELEKYKDYFIFTTQRNPYERVVSAWTYLQKDFPDHRKIKRTFKKGLSLKDTLRNLPKYKKDAEFWSSHDYVHITENQVDTILDDSGKSITSMNIRLENIQEDFNTICDKIGIPRQELPHKNPSKHLKYTEYYDDETKQLVEEKYARDIEYFGYKFGE